MEIPDTVREQLGRMNPEVQRSYTDNWGALRTHHRRGAPIQDWYNFRNNTVGEVAGAIRAVYEDQPNQFKLNMSFGLIFAG